MSETQPLRMRFGGFELDEANARLTHGPSALDVPPRAFAVLCELARRPGQLVTKDALLDAVWGHRHVSESVLKSAISKLRTVLDDSAAQPRFIETASRRGYRFIALPDDAAATAPASSGSDVGPAASRPAPASERTSAATAMTGRGTVLARLQAAWSRARDGQRQLCWLAGEAGIGKTTLVDHFAASLGPALFARGHCIEQHGTSEPYLPVLEALATLTRDDPSIATLLRSVAPTWLLQLPWLCSEAEREGLRRELAGTSQDRMLREFGELLDRCAQSKPLLIVTEDLQWSDHATVNLINHVARRRGRACWMWLATFRVTEIIAEDHPANAMRHELRLHRLGEEILVDPFSEQELADYLVRRCDGTACSDAFVQALHRHTDGLPLFVANVVDDLLAQGLLPAVAASNDVHATLEALALPESLAGVMERRIARLPAEHVALLEAASACGLDVRPRILADVLARDTGWVVQQCELLAQRQQWLVPTQLERGADGELDGRYAFCHAVVRHVFHDRIGALARARLHHRVAQSLVQAAASGAAISAAEIATQFEMGQDPAAALPHCAAAAAGALQQFAPADALRLIDRGLVLAGRCRPDDSVRELQATLHSLRGASAAQVMGVSADETLRSFEQAHTAMQAWPRHPLRSMALHGLGLGLLVRSGPRRARQLAEDSLIQARQRGDPVLIVTACDLLGQILKLEGPPDEAIAVLERGIEAAHALDERTLQTVFVLDPLVNMHAALAIPLLLAGCDRQARMNSDLALARAADLKQPMARMIATWHAIRGEVRRGDREQVVAMATQVRHITDEGALAPGQGPSQWLQGLAQAWSGMPAEGHALIESACRRSMREGALYGVAEALGYAAEALIMAGDRERAERHVDEALALSARLQDHSYRTQLLLLKRRVASARGDRREADDAARQALLEARRQDSPWLEMKVWVDVCEEPHAAARDLEALRGVVTAMREDSDAPLMNRARELLKGPPQG